MKNNNSLVLIFYLFQILEISDAATSQNQKCLWQLKNDEWVVRSSVNIEKLKEKPFSEVNLRPQNPESGFWGRYGIPSNAKVIKAKQSVFRHYTTEDNLKRILKDKKLMAAYVHYEEVSSGLRYVYFDLTGIFATTQKASRTAVGVGEGSQKPKRHYIDFRLPPETILLQLPKDIFLVLGPKAYPPEFFYELKKYEANPKLYNDDFYMKKIEKYKNDGEPQAMQIGIEVIADGVDKRPD